MGARHLVSVPWHVERVYRGEGDERRHKVRCKFYIHDNKYCSRKCCRCMGSAHCMDYVAISDTDFVKRQKAVQAKKRKKAVGGDDDVYWY